MTEGAEIVIAVLICDGDEKERVIIREDCRDQVARVSGEALRVESLPDDEALAEAAGAESLADLLYYDFHKGQSVDTLRQFRRQYDGAMVMLITDVSVSPLEYLRPGVAPDSLFLRPVDRKRLRPVNQEFIESYLGWTRTRGAEASFLVDTREEKLLVPYAHIYFFEARDKKLFVRTRHGEYAFYDTMEALERRLPENFRRCHRNYIVNMEKVLRYLPAENYLELADRIGVPVSRSYKAALREAFP